MTAVTVRAVGPASLSHNSVAQSAVSHMWRVQTPVRRNHMCLDLSMTDGTGKNCPEQCQAFGASTIGLFISSFTVLVNVYFCSARNVTHTDTGAWRFDISR